MPSYQNNSSFNKLSKPIYNTLFKRNSVFLIGVFASAFAFEVVFDRATDKVWDSLNRGKQWKDIEHKYTEE
ncbi:ubiquinol-cytochrome C reductase [Neoconidiobolus thromboides FSU 785]|nr:ubiquinol-cytochrome C reductase [Neoconidiobolus thromboides FSU 785]